MCVFMHVHICVDICVCMYVCACVCMFACICMYIYMWALSADECINQVSYIHHHSYIVVFTAML